MSATLGKEFEQACGLQVRSGVIAARETTFRIGGLFEFFVEPQTIDELAIALRWLRNNSHDVKILGNGSNILAPSSGVSGFTLRLGRGFNFLERLENDKFNIGAAYSLMSASRELSSAGFSGLEFAAGIPGSLGGALVMNAGAHRGEMSHVVTAIEVMDREGRTERLEAPELTFSYRHSSLGESSIVTSVEIRLKAGDSKKILENLNKNLNYRKGTQPLSQPSAGSVFRNPGSTPELSAGAILDSLGLKGVKSGKAQISTLHANWIVNPEKDAQSSDVLSLIKLCQERAREHRSLSLKPEIVLW